MEEKQTEMSLDEVLSSIKQMVVDKDPPVLELTDMVSSDGTIVKVQNGQKEVKGKSELRDFLRLAQEKGQDTPFLKNPSVVKNQSVSSRESNEIFDTSFDIVSDSVSDFVSGSVSNDSVSIEKDKGLPKQATKKNPIVSEETKITMDEIIREVASPIIKEWLEKNLTSLTKEVVTDEIRKMIKQS